MNDTVEVWDPFLAAYAIACGLELRGTRRGGAANKLCFAFDADPMLALFQRWGQAEVPADLRRYLASLRYVRSRMATHAE
jgi:hypothetical protein